MTHVTCRLTAKDRDQLRNPKRSVIEYGLPFYTLQRLTVVESSFGRHRRLVGETSGAVIGAVGGRGVYTSLTQPLTSFAVCLCEIVCSKVMTDHTLTR